VRYRLRDNRQRSVNQDFSRLLDPAFTRRLDRQRLREFHHDLAAAIEYDGFGIGGAFVQRNDELFTCCLH